MATIWVVEHKIDGEWVPRVMKLTRDDARHAAKHYTSYVSSSGTTWALQTRVVGYEPGAKRG